MSMTIGDFAAHSGGPLPPPRDRLGEPGMERLRELLLGREQALLEEIHRRLNDPAERVRLLLHDLTPCLLEGRKRDASLDELAEALVPYLERGLERSVRQDRGPVTQALSPVIAGAAVRYAASLFESLVNGLNQKLELWLSPRTLWWRLEARLRGVPFTRLLAERAGGFRLGLVSVLDRDTLVPLAHFPAAEGTDTSESRLAAETRAHQSAEAWRRQEPAPGQGEWTVLLHDGTRHLLAAEFMGSAPGALHRQLAAASEELDRQLAGVPAHHLSPVPAEAVVEKNLAPPAAAPDVVAAPGSASPWVLRAFWITAAVGLAAFTVAYVRATLTWGRAIAAVEKEPGFLFINGEKGWLTHRLTGLRDPLARAPARVLEDAGLKAENFQTDFHPWASMEAGLADKRAGLFTSKVAATLDSAVAKTVEDRIPPAVRAELDKSREAGEAKSLKLLREMLALPPSVTLTLKDGVLKATGSLEEPSHGRLVRTAQVMDHIEKLDFSGLRNPTEERLEALVRESDGTWIPFDNALTTLPPGTGAEIEHVASLGREALALAEKSGRTARLLLSAVPPSVGAEGSSRAVAAIRLAVTRDALASRGLPTDHFDAGVTETGIFDPALPARRGVRMRITLGPPSHP